MMGWRKVRGGRERERKRVLVFVPHTELLCISMSRWWSWLALEWRRHIRRKSRTHDTLTSIYLLFSLPLSLTPPLSLSPHSLSASSAHSTARPHLSVQEEAPIVRGWVQQWWMMEEMNKWPSDLMHVSGAYCHCANSQRGDHPQLLWAFQINPWTHKCVSLCKGRAGGFSRTHAYCRL